MSDLTADRVRELLDYNPDTGVFTWKVRPARRVHVGDVAGTTNYYGYKVFQVEGRIYRASRLAFLITHNRWPDSEVDHINGIRDDDRAANLREVSHRKNGQNLPVHRAGKLCGTRRSYRSKRNPWRAQMRIDGKTTHLGCFPTEQQAHEAYMKACEAV